MKNCAKKIKQMDAIMDQIEFLFNNSWHLLLLFMKQGGIIVWILALVAIFIWLLVIERFFFLSFTFKKLQKKELRIWQQIADKKAWSSRMLYRHLLFDVHTRLFQSINLIKALVMICPMLGLLGTVTGMITIFDLLATENKEFLPLLPVDEQMLNAGLSRAILPTLVGMVIALSGTFIHARLVQACHKKEQWFLLSLREKGD